eukprot:1896441-Pyramimonas_sp.AAC.1
MVLPPPRGRGIGPGVRGRPNTRSAVLQGAAVPARLRDGRHRRGENIPTLPASDWSVVGIYPRFLRLIGLWLNK